MKTVSGEQRYWNPYIGGVLLGILLFLSFFLVGHGLGASGGLARCGAWVEHLIAPARAAASATNSWP